MDRTTCMIALVMLILGCFTTQAASKKYHLRIGIMYCRETEDSSVDEIYIYKYADGYYQAPWLKWYTASAGLYHRFNSYGTFDSSYEIKAWDLDDFSKDDFIGSVIIDSSNIDDEYVRMNYYGDYSLTWTNLTPHHNTLKQRHSSMTDSKPTRSQMVGYKSNVDHQIAVDGHRALHNHIHQGGRRKKIHEGIKKAIHTFKKTKNLAERKAVIDELKESLGINPVRGIIKNIHDGIWPTVILYGPAVAADFGFASFNIEYGIALQLDGSKAALVLGFNMDVGFTEGDEGKIGIGLNRNEIEGVPGWTYGYTKESYEGLTGGITTSFDLALLAPNLQEITYTWGLLPSGNSAGYTYTVAKGNF